MFTIVTFKSVTCIFTAPSQIFLTNQAQRWGCEVLSSEQQKGQSSPKRVEDINITSLNFIRTIFQAVPLENISTLCGTACSLVKRTFAWCNCFYSKLYSEFSFPCLWFGVAFRFGKCRFAAKIWVCSSKTKFILPGRSLPDPHFRFALSDYSCLWFYCKILAAAFVTTSSFATLLSYRFYPFTGTNNYMTQAMTYASSLFCIHQSISFL